MNTPNPRSRKAVATLLAAVIIGPVVGLGPAATATASSAPDLTAADVRQQERTKAVAVHVLKGLFEDGDLSLANRYIRPDYIEHSPSAADGREPLKEFVRAWVARYPDLKYDVKRVLAEGNMVLVHSNVVAEPGTQGQAVVDIFRFQGGRMAEHWDVLQDVPETTVSGNDMFSTVSSPRTNRPGTSWATASNKRLVTAYFDRLLVAKDPGAVKYLASKHHQHSPAVPNGSAGLREFVTSFFQKFPELTVERKRVVAEGDLVAVHSHYRLNPADRGQSVIDVFRVRNRKIVEHRDVMQGVPETSANDNTMF
ncbi:nuclear transport factor 2 family protein [Streptomyces phaeochromogenes]